MKVVVTGANGFIGNAIFHDLAMQGYSVIAWSRSAMQHSGLASRIVIADITESSFASILDAERPDCIVHCAGSASVGRSIIDPDNDYRSNVEVTRNIYSACSKANVKPRIVFLSSAAVYGEPSLLPISESTTPCKPISPYGRHKLQCEELGQWYAKHHAIKIINLRIFSAYGVGLSKQVLWDIAQKSAKSNVVLLGGDGTETRDLVYVDDLARVVRHFVNLDFFGSKSLDVASGQSVTIRDLAETLLSELGYCGNLCFSGEHSPGSPRYWSAKESTFARLKIKGQTSLIDGIRNYAIWTRSIDNEADSRRILARAG